ncbi:CHAT domain-containing protein, partial [Thermodesulfobacteriota bacterium]
ALGRAHMSARIAIETGICFQPLAGDAQCLGISAYIKCKIDLLRSTPENPAGTAKAEARRQQAWKVAQKLKMRRILYSMAAVAAHRFPGIPSQELDALRRLQYDAINLFRRLDNSSLQRAGVIHGTGATEKDAKLARENIESSLATLAVRHPRYAALMRGNAPSLKSVRELLAENEFYLTLLVTRRAVHKFLIGKGVFDADSASEDNAEIRNAAESVLKGRTAGNYRIDKNANQLWKQLFSSFAKTLGNAGLLIVEPDGFLTMFPFEVLVPGEFPQSRKEQLGLPMLVDLTQLERSTSAFRFTAKRRKAGAVPTDSMAVLAHPDLPKVTGASKGREGSDALLSIWKAPLAKFSSSYAFKDPALSARLAVIFGDRGTFIRGDGASVFAFTEKALGKYPLVHVACPALLPDVPAGTLGQPFMVFSGGKHDPTSGFCAIPDILSEPRPTELLTLTWPAHPDSSQGRGLVLLLEALALSGTKSVLLPLWHDRSGKDDESMLLDKLYSQLKEGKPLPTAMKEALSYLKTHSKTKNPLRLFRFVVY